jgi:hypothetical protein
VKNGTNECALPPLIGEVITDPNHYIDNIFADTWKELINARIKGAGFTKHSGIDITEAVFLLLPWKWINVSSIALFPRKAQGMFAELLEKLLIEFTKSRSRHSNDNALAERKKWHRGPKTVRVQPYLAALGTAHQ